MTRRTPWLLAATAVLVGSCIPTMPCACPPARTHAVVHGTVRTAAGAPAPGARVTPTIHHAACGGEHPETDGWASADAAGRYRAHVHSVSGPRTACVRLSARASGAADSTLVDVQVPFGPERVPPDSVHVDLTLP